MTPEEQVKKTFDEFQHYIAELGQNLRIAFSDYIKSEGCSCCRDLDAHDDASKRIGKLLCFNKFEDSDKYNFYDIPERINNVVIGIPKHITVEYFTERVGRPPEQDDLNRCNCPEEGTILHWSCGWCDACDKPQFICGCRIKLMQRSG